MFCVCKHISCDQTLCYIYKIIFIGVFSINFFLYFRFHLPQNKALLSHANTQSPDIIAYSPIELLQAEYLYIPALLYIFR